MEYTIPVKYTFKGTFTITARSIEEAEEFAINHCGLVIGGDIHSSLPEDQVNWDFPIHPEKEIGE